MFLFSKIFTVSVNEMNLYSFSSVFKREYSINIFRWKSPEKGTNKAKIGNKMIPKIKKLFANRERKIYIDDTPRIKGTGTNIAKKYPAFGKKDVYI